MSSIAKKSLPGIRSQIIDYLVGDNK